MKKHYQNIIVACCFLIMFVNQGLPSTSFNVWQSYLVNEPGVGDGGVSAVLLTRTLVSFLSIFAVSRYYKLLDLRRGVALATLFTIAGFTAYGFAGDNLALYCLGSVLAGIGYGLGGTVASTALIGNWFKGDVGTAAGIAGVGSGAAGMVVPLVVAQIVQRTSLADAFFSIACLALVFGVLVFLFVRSQPSDLGLEPYVVKKKHRTGRLAQDEARAQAAEVPEPLPRGKRILMLIAMALLGADAISASNYFSVTLSTSGIDIMLVATITAVMGASLALAKFVSGKLFDIIGTYKASLLFFIALVAGAALGALVRDGGTAAAIGAAILFGAGCALSTTGLSVWSIELSSPKDKLNNVRDFMIAYSFGGFVFNGLPGLMKSLTGTYETSFIVFTAGSIICMALVLHVLKSRQKQHAKTTGKR